MTEDQILKLKKRLQESRKSLSIARLPDKTKESFMELANEEFCGDYGMAFREILNYYFEHNAMKLLFFQNIDMKLDLLLDKIQPQTQSNDQFETRKMVNGREIKKTKGGKNE